MKSEKPSYSDSKMFPCKYPDCNQSFRTKFSCKRHMLTHTKEKKFACDVCGRKFTLAQHLKEHSYRHSQEKPYICGVDNCQQAFRHASELSLHRRTHPAYKLRKYKYMEERWHQREEIIKPDPVLSEPETKIKEIKADSIELETLGKTSSKFEDEKIPVTGTLELFEEDYGLDTKFLEYLKIIAMNRTPPSRPVLPLPGIYFVGSGNNIHCRCRCHCDCGTDNCQES